MLVDPKDGPFWVETWREENIYTGAPGPLCWRVVNRDGTSDVDGMGCATEGEARAEGAAHARRELA